MRAASVVRSSAERRRAEPATGRGTDALSVDAGERGTAVQSGDGAQGTGRHADPGGATRFRRGSNDPERSAYRPVWHPVPGDVSVPVNPAGEPLQSPNGA